MATHNFSRAVVAEFKQELQQISYQKKASSQELLYFVTESDLLGFWRNKKMIQFFERLRVGINQDLHIPKLLFDGVKLVSTLIWIGFTEWSHFHDLYFTPHGNISLLWDIDLPCHDVLQNDGANQLFKTTERHWFLQEFESCQHIFTPLGFKEGTQIVELRNRTIPILEASDGNIGEGASSTVTKAYIPETCLKTKDSHTRYLGNWLDDDERKAIRFGGKLHRVACKRIRLTNVGQEMGKQELKNLGLLSTRHINHMNLAQSIAAISVDDSKQIVVLFELAKCDFQQFLLGKHDSPFHARLTDLLEQMYWIGDAILFLHESLGMHLDTGTVRKAFCHLDIKPANILMYEPENRSEIGDRVGTWKLTDFGISGENELKSLWKRGRGTWTLSESVRFGGTFTAPEIHAEQAAGRAADVWSLGCVLFLATVLGIDFFGLRKIYGDNGLMCRSTNDQTDASDDYFYRDDEENDNPLSGKLNPHVQNWLVTCEQRNPGSPTQLLVQIIKEMLTVDPDKRIQTRPFLHRFQNIIKAIREQMPPPPKSPEAPYSTELWKRNRDLESLRKVST